MSIMTRHLETFVIKKTGRVPRCFLTRCAVVSGPRTTGDGCYESCVAGPEAVLVEITV